MRGKVYHKYLTFVFRKKVFLRSVKRKAQIFTILRVMRNWKSKEEEKI